MRWRRSRKGQRPCPPTGRWRWREMQAAAETWKQRAPDSPAAPDLAIAQAHLGLKEYDAVLRQLKPYVAAMSADPDKYADQLMLHSVATIHNGKVDEVGASLWPLCKVVQWRCPWCLLCF